MKNICLLFIVFYAIQAPAEIEVINLGKGILTKETIVQQTLFAKEVEKAIEKVKPGDVEVKVVINETNDLPHPAKVFLIPSFPPNSKKQYHIHLNPETLVGEATRYEHIAMHELIHVRSRDPEGKRDYLDDGEIERRVEYDVYKLVGWERYSEYLKYSFAKSSEIKNTTNEEYYIESVKKWLGISTAKGLEDDKVIKIP